MKAVGIRRLKDRLSEYVRLAGTGEVVLVTDRDRVVAELGPPRADRPPEVSDVLLADLVRTGLLTPARVVDRSPPPRVPSATWSTLEAELAADRSDR